MQRSADARSDHALTIRTTALRILGSVCHKKGKRYRDVTRRCVDCLLDARHQTLGHDHYQEAIIDPIVSSLIHYLEALDEARFCRVLLKQMLPKSLSYESRDDGSFPMHEESFGEVRKMLV